ncbi:hypothetical protein VSH64_18310 [Amycolatopsis rhabdoformis]|uniref:Integral membrane protein n=1 Tax=Amycolatopsis rhabdoformis TaxID=1448059 RepID=A0ABZ1IJW8_9PSEU|nr:hypothetical protein [Amycolatopsis rhabdoformis]WSE34028.1 hypothetical protein VSH64_18310 [Amycolatopsis rhabdoformis]
MRPPTRLALTRLSFALVGCALLTLVTSAWAVGSVFDTAALVRDRTTQAIIEVAAARDALVSADAAAVMSFTSGEAKLAGPGQEFENQMAAASQSLARVAEFNQAGAAGGGTLQVVEGLVAAYSGAMGQADAHFRQPGADRVGLADLWYASRLLHAPGNVLSSLAQLQDQQRRALDDLLAADGVSGWTIPLWLLPPTLLLALLVLTQVSLRRRFRRRLNPGLLAATLGVAAAVTGLCLAFAHAQQLGGVRDRVDALLGLRARAVEAADTSGQNALADLLRGSCGSAGCGSTVDAFEAGVRQAADRSGPAPDIDDLAVATGEVTSAAAAAADSGGLPVWVPGAVVAAAAGAVLGLRRRVEEYRYRP